MVSDLAFHLASRGWSVGAITSRQRYDDAGARLAPRENVNGVDIRRVWSSRFGRHFLPGRVIDYATFYASAFFAIRRERDAVIVAKTDPPLLSVIAALASRRQVNWLQDLFPEVANALGIRVRDGSLRVSRRSALSGSCARRKRLPASVTATRRRTAASAQAMGWARCQARSS